MAKRLYIVQERMGDQWVTLAKIACPEKTVAHLAELRTVAPEPPGGARYRVIREQNPASRVQALEAQAMDYGKKAETAR